jgi:hypothetical protein
MLNPDDAYQAALSSSLNKCRAEALLGFLQLLLKGNFNKFSWPT